MVKRVTFQTITLFNQQTIRSTTERATKK